MRGPHLSVTGEGGEGGRKMKRKMAGEWGEEHPPPPLCSGSAACVNSYCKFIDVSDSCEWTPGLTFDTTAIVCMVYSSQPLTAAVIASS